MDEKTKAGLLGDIEYFSAKLEADSTSMLFLPLAKAYVELNRFDDAVQVLFRGLDANPEVSTAKTLLAKCYVGMGRVDDAKAILTEVRVLDPNNYAAEKLLGKIYQSENEYKKAIISYKNAYFSAPEDTELRELIEELLAETGMELSDLRDERKLMDDDELLDTIGQELADEVKHEIGDSAERPSLSEEDVKTAVEDIVGHSSDIEDADLSKFEEDDSPPDTSNEIESEMLAEISEDVEPTESLDEVKEAVQKYEQNYFAGIEEREVPVSGGVDALAAELSADFGLDGIKSEEEAFADEDDTESELSGADSAEEKTEESGQEEPATPAEHNIFDDFGDIEEISDEHLASIDDLFSFVPVSEDGEEMEAPAPAAAPVSEAVQEEEESSEPHEIDAEEQLADIGSEVSEKLTEPEAERDSTEVVSEDETVSASPGYGEPDEQALEETAMEETAPEEPASEEPVSEEPQPEDPVSENVTGDDSPAADEPAEETAVYDGAAEQEATEDEAEEILSEQPEIQADEAEEIHDELITDEKIDDALKDVLGDAEQDSAEYADEIIPHNSNLRPVIDVQEAEETPDGDITDEPEDEVIPEDILEQEPELVSEIQQEINRDTELNDELATLFAMDELEERDRKPHVDEYVNTDSGENDAESLIYDPEQLDSETYEQVNRLENLLELIKNNSK